MTARAYSLSANINAAMRNRKMLDAATERKLAIAWRDTKDQKALDSLVMPFLVYVASFAGKFAKMYSADREELMQEGIAGLMHAARLFDPDKGFRFSTYSRAWIMQCMRDFVLNNASSVRIGKTDRQKKVFSNLSRARKVVHSRAAKHGVILTPAQANELIAAELDVTVFDVEIVAGALSPSTSLNQPVGQAYDGPAELIDLIESETAPVEETYATAQATSFAHSCIQKSLKKLNDREARIIKARRLSDTPLTLEELGAEYGVSRERIRQIEVKAMEKMTAYIKPHQARISASLQ